MLLIGAKYNQSMHQRLRQANRVKTVLLSQKSPGSLARSPRRRKQGDIQEMVLSVLLEAGRPLSTGRIHELVEGRLGGPVSRDTVCSCLTVGVRQGRFGLKRVDIGIYEVQDPQSVRRSAQG